MSLKLRVTWVLDGVCKGLLPGLPDAPHFLTVIQMLGLPEPFGTRAWQVTRSIKDWRPAGPVRPASESGGTHVDSPRASGPAGTGRSGQRDGLGQGPTREPCLGAWDHERQGQPAGGQGLACQPCLPPLSAGATPPLSAGSHLDTRACPCRPEHSRQSIRLIMALEMAGPDPRESYCIWKRFLQW